MWKGTPPELSHEIPCSVVSTQGPLFQGSAPVPPANFPLPFVVPRLFCWSHVLDWRTMFAPNTNPPSAIAIRSPSVRTLSTLRSLSPFGLTPLMNHPKVGQDLKATILAIMNYPPIRAGNQLVKLSCVTRVAGSVFTFVNRYGLAGLAYGGDR